MELAELRLMDWHLESLEGPENFEFFASLRPGRAAPADPASLQAMREALLMRQLEETRQQIAFMPKPAENALPATAEAARSVPIATRLDELDARLLRMDDAIAAMQVTLESPARFWRRLRNRWRFRRTSR